MTKTAAATTDTAPEPEAPRPPLVISPKSVIIDTVGQVLRTIVVRLPADFVASDLGEPSIWSRVQGDRGTALRKFDRVVMVSHDEGWLWQAFVAQSGPTFAVLARPERYELQTRRTEYYSDDAYKVVWDGQSFAVIRKADNHTMASGLANEGLAVLELKRLYPAPV